MAKNQTPTNALAAAMSQQTPHKVKREFVFLADVNSTPEQDLKKMEVDANVPASKSAGSPLVKSILNVLNGPNKDSIERLAFEEDPSQRNEYASVFKMKTRLIPDTILKRISIQDDLVAAILNARSAQVSAFGRPVPDRFSTGFKIEPRRGALDDATPEQKEKVQNRIKRVMDKMSSCGETKGWSDEERMTFAQYLSMSARNGLIFGRFATEIVYVFDPNEGRKKFHSFRPIDAGTIYRAAPQKEAQQSVREQARHLLEGLKNKRLEPERFEADEYAWVQVIEGQPLQAFTSEECVVHNLYPVTDYELHGYPVTPLDTVIQAVTTHINITRHNRLYFENGRATRGMLVIESDDVDEGVVGKLRQSFNASINSVNNAWRMPVFGIAPGEKLTWQPIDTGARDMEFQYLSDMNARVILSAFQMSPEELPGYAHLSRGTNNQALSESNNEYKIEAARDVGIRPLIAQFQDFINEVLFPLMDEELSKLCYIYLYGIDAETAEKEAVRIQQDMALHMTYDEILERVEKDPIGKEWGGEYPLNPQIQAVHDKYLFVGDILEHFFGHKGAAQDPQFHYIRDPFYFQFLDYQLKVQQMQMQQQQMQMQAQQASQGGPPGEGGSDEGDGKEGDGDSKGKDGNGGDEGSSGSGGDSGSGDSSQGSSASGSEGSSSSSQGESTDLTRSLDQLIQTLSKSEQQLPHTKRLLLARQKKMVKHVMDEWEKDKQSALDEILDLAQKHAPRK